MRLATARAGLLVVAIALAAIVSGCGASSKDQGPGDRGEAGPTAALFASGAAAGSLERRPGGRYELELRRPADHVTSFSDRPRREAGSEPLSTFVARWGARGFAADPPNAALVLDDAPQDRDSVVLELSKPRLDERTGTLRFSARRVGGSAAPRLTSVAGGPDRSVATRFAGARLFVDDALGPARPLKLEAGLRDGGGGGGTARIHFDGAGIELSGPPLGVSGIRGFQVSVSPTTVEFDLGGVAPDVGLDLSVSGVGPITGTASRLEPGVELLAIRNGNATPIRQNGRFTIK